MAPGVRVRVRIAGEGGERAGAVVTVTVCLCKTRGRHLEERARRPPSWTDTKSRPAGTHPPKRVHNVDRWVPGGRCQREGRGTGAAGGGCSFRLLFLALPWLQQQYAAHQLTRDLRGSGSPGRNWQTGSATHRSSIGRAWHAGYFCTGGSLPPQIVDQSKVRPRIFSKRRNHSPSSTGPAQLRRPRFRLDQTRPDSGKAARRVGNAVVESWCDEALR